jgi:hypothetical protein
MSNNYSARVLANQPRAYYRLDESSGTTMNDSSGNGYNGTLNGGYALSQPGLITGDADTCIQLTSGTGYVDVPAGLSLNGLGAFTIEAWGYITGGSATGRIVASDRPSTNHAGFEMALGTGGNYALASLSGTSYQCNFTAPSLNTRYHYVFTFDGSNLKVYINGANASTVAATGTLDATANHINIGRNPSSGTDFFTGYVDEVAIYKYALSAAQISDHYTAGSITTYAVKIAGSTVTAVAGTLQADLAVGRRGTAQFTVKQPDTSTHYQQYQQVSIYDQNGALIFGGFINQPKEMVPRSVSPAYLTNQMTCMDYRWITDKRVIYESGLAPNTTLAPSTSLAPGSNSLTKVYTNRPYDVIVYDLFNKYLAPEGVTLGAIFTGPYPSPSLAPSTTLAPNGPTQNISQVTLNYPTMTQALDALVASASASGVTFYWSIDQNKQFWFVPYSYVVNSTVVDGTQVDDGRLSGVVPYVTRANPVNRNTQLIAGGTTPGAPRTEYFTGNGQARTWTLAYPCGLKPTIIMNNVGRTVGVQGTSGAAYYYQPNANTITQDSSQAVLVSTDTLEVHYTPALPHTAISQNSAQITAQAALDNTTGIVESVLKDITITSDADGVTEANYLLNVYCVPGTCLFVFATRTSGYYPGQQITVTYAPFNFSSTKMLVASVHLDDQVDGFNIWYTISAVIGPFDATWAQFFGRMLAPRGTSSATAINVGI